MHQCSYGRGALSCGHAQKNVWSEIGWGYLYQTRTIRRELGNPPETVSRQGSRRPSDSWMSLKRVSGGLPSLRRIPVNSLSAVPTERRDTGTFPLGHAARPSVARSGADFPVGSRSQGEGTCIPA